MTLSLTAVNITLERGVKMERYYYRIMCIASSLLTQFQLSVTVKNLMHTVHLVLTPVSTVPDYKRFKCINVKITATVDHAFY